MAKEAVVIVGDQHINSIFGLTHPHAIDNGGMQVNRNEIQVWIYKMWQRFQNDVNEVTKRMHRTWILDGDIVDIDWKKRSWEYITANPSYVGQHAIEIWDNTLDKNDDLFILKGTAAHVGSSAFTEESLGRDLGAIQTSEGRYSWDHLRAIFGGVSFDVAHHYNMGYLPWTYANAAMKLAFETIHAYREWGEPPPQLVVRAHNHRWADSGRTFKTRGICLPAWQFPTEYLHRRGKSNEKPMIGGVVIICENKEYYMREFIYEPKRNPRWKRTNT